jgi:hypothetical protein
VNLDIIAASSFAQFEEWAATHCVFRDKCWGHLKSLHRHFSIFCSGRNPCTIVSLRAILRDQGFRLAGDLVYGLILAEDDPLAQSPRLHAARTERASRVEIPQFQKSANPPGLECAAVPRSAKNYAPAWVRIYYIQVLSRSDLRRQTARDWIAICPEHNSGKSGVLTINLETGQFKCSDRYCDLFWGGRNIFHFEMARLRRENGSVPGCDFVAASINRLLGEDGASEQGAA